MERGPSKPPLLPAITCAVCLIAAQGKADGKNELPNDRGKARAEREERVSKLATNDKPRVPRAWAKRVPFDMENLWLKDACGALEELYGADIVLDVRLKEKKGFRVSVREQPLSHALDDLCSQAMLDWETYGHFVYVGTKNAVARYRQVFESRAERRKRYPASIARTLQEKTAKLWFNDYPLSEVAKSLGELHSIPVRVDADSGVGKRRITFRIDGVEGVELDVALDLICALHGLEWSVTKEGRIEIRPEIRLL